MVMSAVAACSSFSGNLPTKRGMSLAATLCAQVPPAGLQRVQSGMSANGGLACQIRGIWRANLT